MAALGAQPPEVLKRMSPNEHSKQVRADSAKPLVHALIFLDKVPLRCEVALNPKTSGGCAPSAATGAENLVMSRSN